MRADRLKRGDRVHVAGQGWRALSRVSPVHRADWIGEGPGPAITLSWRHKGITHRQDVKPDAEIPTLGENED